MTGPLLKVTSTPFQSVRISQSARLVSSDSVELERRKAIARVKAFQSQHSAGGGMDLKYVNQINRTFSVKSSQNTAASSSQTNGGNTAVPETSQTQSTKASASAGNTVSVVSHTSTVEETAPSQVNQAAVTLESNSAYTMDRGAFEFRVAKGELAFLPPLDMTIITQRPEVHFEYTGGFHYVPASLFEDGALNLSI
ncbi:MAG: hypothetical protein HFI93_01095 [Lachnospiraceae bacterium]|nr:hypothetical protein [Lachnospiraceae bacterium]